MLIYRIFFFPISFQAQFELKSLSKTIHLRTDRFNLCLPYHVVCYFFLPSVLCSLSIESFFFFSKRISKGIVYISRKYFEQLKAWMMFVLLVSLKSSKIHGHQFYAIKLSVASLVEFIHVRGGNTLGWKLLSWTNRSPSLCQNDIDENWSSWINCF